MTERMEGLVSANPRGIGGETVGTLLVGIVGSMESQIRDAKNDNRHLTRKNEDLQSERTADKVRIGILEGQLLSLKQNQKQRAIFLSLGAFLLAKAFELYKIGPHELAYLLGLIGVGLLAVGYFPGLLGKTDK